MAHTADKRLTRGERVTQAARNLQIAIVGIDQGVVARP
jgi:hypothetical protein